MSAEPNLNETDYELLSAYIDDMLTDNERIALEARLKVEPTLRRELNALRQTVALVKALPTLKAPRNFTLTPAMLAVVEDESRPDATIAPNMVSGKRIIPFPLVSVLSAAASMILIVMGLLLFTTGGDNAANSGSVALRNTEAAIVGVTSNISPNESRAFEATEEANMSLDLFADGIGGTIEDETATTADDLNDFSDSDSAAENEEEIAEEAGDAPPAAAVPILQVTDTANPETQAQMTTPMNTLQPTATAPVPNVGIGGANAPGPTATILTTLTAMSAPIISTPVGTTTVANDAAHTGAIAATPNPPADQTAVAEAANLEYDGETYQLESPEAALRNITVPETETVTNDDDDDLLPVGLIVAGAVLAAVAGFTYARQQRLSTN